MWFHRPLLAVLLLSGGCSIILDWDDDLPVPDGGSDDGAPSGDADSDGSADPDGRPDADLCTGGTLCGQPAVCCPAGNECVESSCLPACPSGVRCGAGLAVCCAAANVCISDVCAAPGATCTDSYDCDPGQFCEPTLGRCLPQPDPLTCEQVPVFSDLTTTVEWSAITDQIISIPVVADIDADLVPEVVVNLTMMDAGSWPSGTIAVRDGQTGLEDFRIPHLPASNQYGSHGRSTIAVGDVSGDGVPDIVYATRYMSGSQSLIVAVDGSGALLWKSHTAGPADAFFTIENAAITLANFDADAAAEVVIGASLIDNDGLVVWDQGGGGAGSTHGSNLGYVGGIAAVADLDDDGVPEIVSGREAWKVAWSAGPVVAVSSYWTYAGDDGYPAVADLDGNGTPEVVLVANSRIIALNGQSGLLWCGVDPSDAACVTTPALRTAAVAIPGGNPTSNRGGPPTIADFDADGRPEVGVAGGYAYSVYDFNRAGEDVVKPPADPAPAAGAVYVRWSAATQDLSSNATGSSVFDFQGDGAAEVVYADETMLRVYSGTDGHVQLAIPNSSSTIHEYPLVVDVDADGNSEILVVANNDSVNRGLFVYGDLNDEWVPTRRVWTQHSYHVTNATSAGNVPAVEADNWTLAGLNNCRQNVQGDGVFNAPDLTVGMSVSLDLCNTSIELRARVSNQGALGVPPGVVVTFYQGAGVLGTGATVVPLLPGASTTVALVIPAPTVATDYRAVVDGTAATTVAECDVTNNEGMVTQARCIIIE